MFIVMTRAGLERKLQEEWEKGYLLATEEDREAMSDKDAFNAQQSELLTQVAALPVDVLAWAKLPDKLRMRLGYYL